MRMGHTIRRLPARGSAQTVGDHIRPPQLSAVYPRLDVRRLHELAKAKQVPVSLLLREALANYLKGVTNEQ